MSQDSTEATPTKSTSSLSVDTKLRIIHDLQKANPDDLKKAFGLTILEEKRSFRCLFDNVLDALRFSFINTSNLPSQAKIKAAITQYIEDKGFEIFYACLIQNSTDILHSEFLQSIAEQSKIPINHDPMVEAEVRKGKVHWQIVDPNTNKVIYSREENKPARKGFPFNKAKTWRMTWQNFRDFKDSGKRTGTLQITQLLFIKYAVPTFPEAKAKKIWDELYKIGILNKNCRLSLEWHAFFNEKLQLKPLTNLEDIAKVIDIIYKILDSEKSPEVLPGLPGFTIYRPDRSRKSCAGTGRVTNQKNEGLKPTRWDIGPWGLFNTIRGTTAIDLDFDHIPSRDRLKNYVNTLLTPEQEGKVLKLKQELINLKKEQKNLKKLKQSTADVDKKIDEKNVECSDAYLAVSPLFHEYFLAKGELWLTVALPRTLHDDAASTMTNSKEQEKVNQHPFLHHIEWYFGKLETEASKYGLTKNDFSKAAGAFRQIFSRHLKKPVAINGLVSIGLTPFQFFQSRAIENTQIDDMFNNAMQKHTAEPPPPNAKKNIFK